MKELLIIILFVWEVGGIAAWILERTILKDEVNPIGLFKHLLLGWITLTMAIGFIGMIEPDEEEKDEK